MERKLKRFPAETDLSERFEPGIRFYFQYDTLIRHPNAVCDGVLPMKIKNEIILFRLGLQNRNSRKSSGCA